MLMQEVYYRNQSHKAAQRRSHRLMRRGPDPRAHQHSDPTVQEPSRAQELIHGWSQSSNSPSLKDLCAAQVLIEGWTADQFEYNDYWTEVPVNLGTLQEEVLRFQKSPDGKEGAWKAFTRLPVVCQNAITQKLQEIVKEYRWGKEYGSPVLLAVEYNTNRWPRLRNKLKGLLPFHTLSRRVPQLFIITARAPLERSKRHDRYSSSEAPIILNRHYGSRDAPVIIPRARRSQPRPDSVRHRDLISDDTDYVSEVEDGEVPPSRDDVLGAAHFLLRKWTTVFPHVNDKLRGRIWDSGTIAHKSLHRVLTQFPPRPEPVRRWSGFPPLPRNSTVETVQEDAERQNYRYSNRRRGDWKEIEVHNSRPRSKGRSSSSFYCRDDPEFAKQFHERDRPPRQKQRKYLHPEGDQYTTRRYRRQDFSGPEEEDEQYDDEDEIEVDVEVEYEDEPPRQRERGSPGPPRLTNKKSNASRDERIETNSSFHREPRDRTGTDMSQRWSDQDTLNSRHARA